MTECVICGAELKLDDTTIKGEVVECPECGSELEVLSVNPVVVGEAPTEEEDWGE